MRVIKSPRLGQKMTRLRHFPSSHLQRTMHNGNHTKANWIQETKKMARVGFYDRIFAMNYAGQIPLIIFIPTLVSMEIFFYAKNPSRFRECNIQSLMQPWSFQTTPCAKIFTFNDVRKLNTILLRISCDMDIRSKPIELVQIT